jgi:predicted NBD/HSP70 family sugar kinase
MRAMHRATILDTVRNTGLISRRDIARQTGLSQASITGLTADLIREGLLMEKQTGTYDGGRRPILMALNPDGAHVVGVNLSFSEINVAVIDFEATVKAAHTLPLPPRHHTPQEVTDLIVKAVQACLWESNFSKDRIAGIGLGIPGLIDAASGEIRFLPNYDWRAVNLRDRVQTKLNHPTYIDNSSNTLAMTEQWFGSGRGVDDFLVATIQNGGGLGGVIQGRIHRGHGGTAGEFGHNTIDPEGPLCRCGKKGCIEAYAGNNSILAYARQAAEAGLWSPPDPAQISFETVVQAAEADAEVLRERFAKAGQVLAMGLSHLINLYNPAKIIITGKGVKAGDLLFAPLNKALPDFLSPSFAVPASAVEIVIKPWSDTDWVRGAGALVLQELYKSPVGQVVNNA